MNPQKFIELTELERETLIIANYVRNRMENFHVKHLSDKQMKELNPMIREGILEGLIFWNTIKKFEKSKRAQKYNKLDVMKALALFIPDYWEIPTEAGINKEMRKLKKSSLV